MGMGANHDPGEDPQTELDRLGGQLDGNLLGKQSRKSLGARAGTLKSQLGIGNDEY